MKQRWLRRADLLARGLLFGLLGLSMAASAAFDSGSNGSYGPIDVPDYQTLTLTLPPDGIFHATTISLGQSATLNFNRNALNTPVYLLAQGDISFGQSSHIDVFGENTLFNRGGYGGPGGFDGGMPGNAQLGIPAGAGYGPGAGLGGRYCQDSSSCDGPAIAGSAAHLTAATGLSAGNGSIYGSVLLVPPLGGSGGGGNDGDMGNGSYTTPYGGGGGGGALVLASSTRIDFGPSAYIQAYGGSGPYLGGNGSGGVIRLISPRITGYGNFYVHGGGYYYYQVRGGDGLVRIDTEDRSAFNYSVSPNYNAILFSAMMQVFPTTLPRLDLVNVAGQAIPEGTGSSVAISLPSGSPTTQVIRVQARDFTGTVPIRVALIPDSGASTYYDAQINMASNPATVDVNATFPVNTLVHVQSWTR